MKVIFLNLKGVVLFELVVYGDYWGFFMESYNDQFMKQYGFYYYFI